MRGGCELKEHPGEMTDSITADVDSFVLQESGFLRWPIPITPQSPIAADDAMAGDDDRVGILGHGMPDSAPGATIQRCRQGFIGRDTPCRNGFQERVTL